MKKIETLKHYIFNGNKMDFSSLPIGERTLSREDLGITVDVKLYNDGLVITYIGNYHVQEVLTFETLSNYHTNKNPYDHIEIYSIENFNAEFNGSVIDRSEIDKFRKHFKEDCVLLEHDFDNGDFTKVFLKIQGENFRICSLNYDEEFECATLSNTIIKI